MVRLTVYKDGNPVRTYIADYYEDIYECGYENVYVEKDGVRTKALTVGDFGFGYWSYDVERMKWGAEK